MKVHTSFSSLSNLRNPVVTIGTFDGVHLGHRSILKRISEIASDIGGETVLLSFYPHPRMVLHPEDHNIQLLNSPEEKATLLNKAGLDHLMIFPFSPEFSRLSAFEYVRDLIVTGIGAHTVVVGHDHRFGRNREGNHTTLTELAEVFGFRVVEIEAQVVDHVNISSTKIREALIKGKVNEAEIFLGYHYMLSGKVIHGDKIGRTIGYPTANIQPDYTFKLIPARGVYAVRVIHQEKIYNGVLSIGIRPTVTSVPREMIEVHIMDFNSDIYGENISLEFLRYLRPEKKFGSIDELQVEIGKDIENAMVCF